MIRKWPLTRLLGAQSALILRTSRSSTVLPLPLAPLRRLSKSRPLNPKVMGPLLSELYGSSIVEMIRKGFQADLTFRFLFYNTCVYAFVCVLVQYICLCICVCACTVHVSMHLCVLVANRMKSSHTKLLPIETACSTHSQPKQMRKACANNKESLYISIVSHAHHSRLY